MKKQEHGSFNNRNGKEKAIAIISIIILIVFVIGFVFGIFFFGFVGLFEILGVEYHSIWSLVLFVGSFFVLGFFIDLFADAIATVSVTYITDNKTAFIVQLFIGFLSNWLGLSIVDGFMTSITLSFKTKLIVALLLGILEPIFDNKNR